MTSPNIPQQLADQPFVLPLPIQWGDQDMFGHVNNVIYFRWFESARIEFCNRLGLTDLLRSHGLGPILASIKCNYRRQLKHPDSIWVSASVVRLGRTSMQMNHLLYSDSQGLVAADGESTIVIFDYASQKPTPIPDDVRAKLEQIEGRKLAGG